MATNPGNPLASEELSKKILERAAKRITKARTRLLLTREFVFWATLALHLKPRPCIGLGTLGTDGTYLLYDPVLVASDHFDDDELLTVIAHEVSHCAKGDQWRRGAREPGKWNKACDMRINPELLKAGMKMAPPPDDVEFLKAMGLDVAAVRQDYANQYWNMANFGRASEEIYASMPDCPPSPSMTISLNADGSMTIEIDNGSGGKGKTIARPMAGGHGFVIDAGVIDAQTPLDKAKAKEKQEREWSIIAKQAAQIAKSQGLCPAGYEHLLEPIKPQLDPYALIRHYVSMCRKDDYSWARGSRRYAYRNVFLPSLMSEGIGEILIAADVSGSTAPVWPLFVGFLNSVLQEVKPDKTHFIEVDAAVHAHTEFQAGDELPERVAIRGGGGTDMRPIWEYANDHQIFPTCAIVLTDMEMGKAYFGEEQPFPVLWISSEAGKEAPWGQTVEMLE